MAALVDINAMRCDRIICLGDLIDGGEQNAEVVAMIREKRIPTVRGNHDELPSCRIDDETRVFLDLLPEQIVENDVVYTHISPRTTKRKVRDTADAWMIFDDTAYRLVFLGHSHIPMMFSFRDGEGASAHLCRIFYNRPVSLAPDDRYVICPGSLGYSRAGLKKLTYGVYDSTEGTFEMRLIDGPQLNLWPDGVW